MVQEHYKELKKIAEQIGLTKSETRAILYLFDFKNDVTLDDLKTITYEKLISTVHVGKITCEHIIQKLKILGIQIDIPKGKQKRIKKNASRKIVTDTNNNFVFSNDYSDWKIEIEERLTKIENTIYSLQKQLNDYMQKDDLK